MAEDGTEPDIIAEQVRREKRLRQEKMAEDGTEPDIIAAQGRRERRLRQEKMAEDGTEPGIIAGQGRRETPMTGEDGRGWYRTWHHSWTREEGDDHDRRRWQRMVPNLAS